MSHTADPDAVSTAPPPLLSRTRLLAGWQCSLRLWYDCHRPELAGPGGNAAPAVCSEAEQVRKLARQRWPGGVLVVPEAPETGDRETTTAEPGPGMAVARTAELMADPEVAVIYAAAVQYQNVFCRIDILERAPGGEWDFVAVKAAARLKASYALEVMLQFWTLRSAGLRVRRAGVLLLNRDFVYAGAELDFEALFNYHDLSEKCRSDGSIVEPRVTLLQAMLDQPEAPPAAMGRQCHKPYPCRYLRHCGRELAPPEYPLAILPELGESQRRRLLERDIQSIRDIPDDYPLSALQARVRSSALRNEAWLSPQLEQVLERVEWPLRSLDFEAAGFAIPRFAGMRPFDPLPFQFASHTQRAPDAELVHSGFLATAASDPRPALIDALLEALGATGSILVYSSYESRMIRLLARQFPFRRAELLALTGRLVDLLAILREHYYHPGFRGSFSIKNVLPVLIPDAGYDRLVIADGQAAAAGWQRMLTTPEEAERDRIAEALRAYCWQDSWALPALRNALLAEARSRRGERRDAAGS